MVLRLKLPCRLSFTTLPNLQLCSYSLFHIFTISCKMHINHSITESIWQRLSRRVSASIGWICSVCCGDHHKLPWWRLQRWWSLIMLGCTQAPKGISPGAIDFEMEKNSRKLIFQGSCLKVPSVQNRWFSIILWVGFSVIQDGIRWPSWICGIPRFWPM